MCRILHLLFALPSLLQAHLLRTHSEIFYFLGLQLLWAKGVQGAHPTHCLIVQHKELL
jgi:hypothetical protein